MLHCTTGSVVARFADEHSDCWTRFETLLVLRRRLSTPCLSLSAPLFPSPFFSLSLSLPPSISLSLSLSLLFALPRYGQTHVCIYIYIYTHIYTYIYTYIRLNTHKNIQTHTKHSSKDTKFFRGTVSSL